MKRTLPGLFLVLLYALTTAGDYRMYIYVSTPMGWNDANKYCTTYFTDLSTITSEEENQRLVDTGGIFTQAWIGLYKESEKPNSWLWADGQPLGYSKLYLYNNNGYRCVYATMFDWYIGYCPVLRPFFCYDNYRLKYVNLNKTWEDAYDYCRYWYIDLASATEQYQLDLFQNTLQDVFATSVWTGLRFLAGEWHWLSKNFRNISYQGSLQSCPEEPYRCGAYNKTTAQWEMRDCDETLSFICFY